MSTSTKDDVGRLSAPRRLLQQPILMSDSSVATTLTYQVCALRSADIE